MVAVVVEALELHQGDRALDVGTGSGYQAAVMAACGAHVVSIERVGSLASTAAERLRRLDYDVEVFEGDGTLGGPGAGAVRCDRRRGRRATPPGGARPPARRRRPAGGADHRRPQRRGADPPAAGRRPLGDRVARPVPVRAADRRRRLRRTPTPSARLVGHAGRHPEHPDPRRSRADRSTAWAAASPNADASTIPTS